MKGLKWLLAALGVFAAAEVMITVYFHNRTMKRSRAKTERTMKMSGTDWGQYGPIMKERREYMMAQPHQDVWIRSEDGLRLHGTYFPNGNSEKVMIGFHGYTSEGISNHIGISDYFLKRGYGMLLVDQRAHGQSEGDYIGFGCLDRKDAVRWIDWLIKERGEQSQILLFGTSMGGATVLMTSGLPLPPQVKGIISDCAFTSPKEVFTHVLKTMYHLPAFPIIPLADVMNRKLAGYGMDECNAAREVRNAKVPILMIHGDGDTFVPTEMCNIVYKNCASPKKKLIIEGAAHAESYYKDMQAYENALNEFIGGVIK